MAAEAESRAAWVRELAELAGPQYGPFKELQSKLPDSEGRLGGMYGILDMEDHAAIKLLKSGDLVAINRSRFEAMIQILELILEEKGTH